MLTLSISTKFRPQLNLSRCLHPSHSGINPLSVSWSIERLMCRLVLPRPPRLRFAPKMMPSPLGLFLTRNEHLISSSTRAPTKAATLLIGLRKVMLSITALIAMNATTGALLSTISICHRAFVLGFFQVL